MISQRVTLAKCLSVGATPVRHEHEKGMYHSLLGPMNLWRRNVTAIEFAGANRECESWRATVLQSASW